MKNQHQCPQCPAKTHPLSKKIWDIAERTMNLEARLIIRYKLPYTDAWDKAHAWQDKKIKQEIMKTSRV
jgi:hypothetical protein